MLNIDKSTVDFLVTENMVTEVEKVLEKDVPKIRNLVNEMAKVTGALNVSVTRDPSGNLLVPVGDYLVAYEAECVWEIHLLITYTFALELINKVTPNLEITKIQEDISNLPKILGKLVTSWEAKGRTLGEKASNWDIIYTVAAGPLTPLAYKEGVITMMEFIWTHGVSINSSEFLHGPLEILEEGIPFIFLLGTDESRHTTERTINLLRN